MRRTCDTEPVCTPNDFNTSLYNTELHARDEELTSVATFVISTSSMVQNDCSPA